MFRKIKQLEKRLYDLNRKQKEFVVYTKNTFQELENKEVNNTEHNIQAAAVRAFRLIFSEYSYMLVNIPNGAKRSRYEAAIAKSEGMIAGAPDLLLLVPRNGYGCLGIEFKTESKSSKQRIPQIIWQQETEKCGNKYVVVRSVEDFFKEVSAYLGVDNPLGSNNAHKESTKLLNK